VRPCPFILRSEIGNSVAAHTIGSSRIASYGLLLGLPVPIRSIGKKALMKMRQRRTRNSPSLIVSGRVSSDVGFSGALRPNQSLQTIKEVSQLIYRASWHLSFQSTLQALHYSFPRDRDDRALKKCRGYNASNPWLLKVIE
jgi:hypothetical protein